MATSQPFVAFTFDDGPWPTNTADVMKRFEQYGWPATFFMIGVNVQCYPDIARSVVARGFGVAAHSMTHTYGVSTIAHEVEPTAALIQSVTGVRTSWFRSPGLTQSSTIDQAVYTAGMCNISTGSDLGDWVSPRASASTLCSPTCRRSGPAPSSCSTRAGATARPSTRFGLMLSYRASRVTRSSTSVPSSPAPSPGPAPAGADDARLALERVRPSGLGGRGEAHAAARAVMHDEIYLRGGADGIYGPYTAAAVATYQSRRGLPATGAVDDATAAAMGLCPTPPPRPRRRAGVRVVRVAGSRGEAVVRAQRAVMNDAIYLRGGADGIFGPYTAAAVATYQSRRGLPAIGAVDNATAAAMGLCTTATPPPRWPGHRSRSGPAAARSARSSGP